MKFSIIAAMSLMPGIAAFAPSTTPTCISAATASTSTSNSSTSLHLQQSNRRKMLQALPSLAFFSAASATIIPQPSNAFTNAKDGNLPDLPTEATRSYLQYRIPLQIAADFYIFDLRKKLSDVDDWGDINQLFQVNNNKGQGQPSKMERDYVNPMRILSLSMPPDEADDMRAAQFKFERAMNKISKAVSGIRRDLPVEVDTTAVTRAEEGWDDGRVALNEFFALLNSITGFEELKPIPPPGPNQVAEYGRSQRKYNELVKKTKQCQNRGGPALSQAWGYLQTTQLLQDSCGIPDLDEYFYQ